MTPTQQSAAAREICLLAPVVPVIVIRDVAHAAPMAKALVAGGLPALEVTLRTPCALDAIRAMADIEGGVVGAGTLLTPADVKAAKAAGAKFGVSPGATDTLIKACEDEGLPLLPGAATASEVMYLLERGFTTRQRYDSALQGTTDNPAEIVFSQLVNTGAAFAGRPLPGFARHVLLGQTTWRHAGRSFSLLRLTWRGERFSDEANALRRAPGWSLALAHGWESPDRRWSFTGTVQTGLRAGERPTLWALLRYRD